MEYIQEDSEGVDEEMSGQIFSPCLLKVTLDTLLDFLSDILNIQGLGGFEKDSKPII
jgi:hypothetical protein